MPWDLDLLTPDDVCTLLKVKKSWLYDTVESGAIEAIRLGKQLRFQRSAIAAYIAEQKSTRALLLQRRQQPFEPLRRGLSGLVKHMHIPRGRPQICLAQPVHYRLRALPSVDQPGGVGMANLVGSGLERDTAVFDRGSPDPVPDLLVQVRLVGVTRLLPAAPCLAGRGRPPLAHPLAAVLARPLPAAGAAAFRPHIATHRAVRVHPAADRLTVT